jgi:hypothetical protein
LIHGRCADAIPGELLTYLSLPFYRAMIERSGYGEDIAAFDAANRAVAVMRSATDFEDMVEFLGSGDVLQPPRARGFRASPAPQS